jgi:hypothetical protein
MSIRKLVIVGSLMLSVSVGVIVATGVASGAGTSARVRHYPGHPSVSKALRGHFEALGARIHRSAIAGGASSAPSMTPGMRTLLSELGPGSNEAGTRALGIDIASVNEVVGAHGQAVWTEGGSNGACIATLSAPAKPSNPNSAAPYSACGQTQFMLTHGLLGIGLEPDGSHVVYAIVPNGTVSVVVSDGDQSATIPVQGGAVADRIGFMPTDVQLVRSDGSKLSLLGE